MENKHFLSQSNYTGPNYGKVFREETERRVHCPDLEIDEDTDWLDLFFSAGIIIVIMLLVIIALEWK